jgi:hypothetical protein
VGEADACGSEGGPCTELMPAAWRRQRLSVRSRGPLRG